MENRKKLITYLYQSIKSWNAEDGVLQVVTDDGTNNFKTEQANDIVDAMTTQALALAKPNLCIACNAARKRAPYDYCGACNAARNRESCLQGARKVLGPKYRFSLYFHCD